MDKVLQRFQHLKIQLEEITSATNNFDDEKNYVGGGGFGRVYKGEVSHSEGRSMVAIKRLDRSHGQGEAEFLKEITTLSHYRHDNLISLLGFCYQGDEAILVYEFASRGSLEEHLGSRDLTWSQRIKICLDAAKGLSHLHDPRGTHQRLIHCDVKSANILLDDQWNAKVSDFGFSIMGPANELQSAVINLAAGTLGYCDPEYAMTNTLTKESDVYSFGVVLFEVLFGRLCYTVDSNGCLKQILVPIWKECYEKKKLNDIIFKSPTTQPLYQSPLETFSDIAYRCLRESREDRPKMSEVVTELETALKVQEYKSSCYDDILKSAEPPLNYGSEDELMMLLSKGVLLNGGKTYFSLNKMGEHYEMISSAECLGSEFECGYTEHNSRFPKGTYRSENGIFKTHVKTQFLSHGITYTVNLVFKFSYKEKPGRYEDIYLKYKLQGEAEPLVSKRAYEREDGWWVAKLDQFTCDHKVVDLQILFDGFHDNTTIDVEGIEFRPSDKRFSLNKKGEHCEMISIAECLDSEFKFWGKDNSRQLPEDTHLLSVGIFKTHVKTQFLSPGITYTVNLVFKFKNEKTVRRCERISLKYKLQGEAETSVSYLGYEREDGWLMAELYQLTCDNEIVNLKILFEGFVRRFGTIEVQGIEFVPLEKEYNEGEKQPVSDGDAYANWEEKLPADYEDIMKRSKNSLQWTTEEEAYSIMTKGFLVLEKWKGSIWFFLDKKGKKCIMISTRCIWNQSAYISLPESRFGKASPHNFWSIELKEEVQSQLISPDTTYGIYFVYKVSKDQFGFEAPMEVENKLKLRSKDNISYIYLASPQTPVIKPKADQNTHNAPSKPIKKSLPQQRNDGWMEVQLSEFESDTTTKMIPTHLKLITTGDYGKKFRGLIIDGIEIRPI